MARLIRIQDEAGEAVWLVGRISFLIGRSDAGDLDIDDPSVSSRHAMIQLTENGYLLADLGSTNGTLVNDKEIDFQPLADGDRICFGDVEFRFELDSGDPHPGGASEFVPVVPPPQLPVRVETHLPAPAMPQHPVPYDPFPPVPRGPGMLPILALLAALTIVGFPIALLLGVMAFVQIGRFGGTRQDRLLTHWALGLATFWLVVVCATGGLMAYRHYTAQQAMAAREAVAVNEGAVIRAMKGLACAQRFARTVELKDVDGDGEGEFLDPAALVEAGSVFFDVNLADGEAYGYRFFMQDLSEDRYLVVAEPIAYGQTGRRTFAIDQTGRLRAADGEGRKYAEIGGGIPILAGEPTAFYEKDDEIAKDIIHFTRGLSMTGEDLERADRILRRVREEFALTSVGRELLGVTETTDLFMQEKRAKTLYDEAAVHLDEGRLRAAIGAYDKILETYGDFSRYEEVFRGLQELKARLLDEEERAAKALMEEADALELESRQDEAREIYLKIERLYPDTETAARVIGLKGNMEQQLREKAAEDLFFALMELDPRQDSAAVLSLVDQLNRNYDDTALHAANGTSIAGQARKARAEKWRTSTRADMEAGRTRGALAQLEAAARENPDIRYDLRDLFIELYRSVGERLVREGDDREALRVHLALDRLLQYVPDAEQVDPARMARLHNKIGIAELDLHRYEQAHWHLSNAAWSFKDDARFQLRLGIANLYTGQYQPAIVSFARTIELDDTAKQAYLYRAYAIVRQILTLQPDIADVFAGAEAYAPHIRGGGEEGASPSMDTSGADDDTAPGPRNSLRPPPPADLDLDIDYNFTEGSALVPETLRLIGQLQETMMAAEAKADETRGEGRDRVTAEQIRKYAELSEYRNKVSALRAVGRRNVADQKEFMAILDAARMKLELAGSDLQKATRLDPSLMPVLRGVYDELLRKHDLLRTSTLSLRAGHQKELKTLTHAIFCCETLMAQMQQERRRGLSISKMLRDTLLRAGDRKDFDAGLLALDQALEVEIDIDEILEAAEGSRSSTAP